MQLVDSHSHFDADEFDGDREAALTSARDAGVQRQVLPAVTETSWSKLRDVCSQHEGLHPAYGLHPLYLQYHRARHLDALRDWIERERPVAIGECGLDFYVEGLDADTQHRYFNAQLQLAREFDLPVIVHARRAVEAVIVAIKRVGHLRGVVHSFPGSEEQARQLWNLGFMLGIGGPVTYERANRLRRLVATMSIEHLLLETDSPDQPDAFHRGQRNEPSRLPIVLRTIAGLRGESEEVVAAATTANAERLFGLR
ncbi:MAG: TatD family hydrolase [Pseudomonadota bacterium]|nr:TatD family hydrolase [Pseudomonadota bacterium]